MESGISSGFSLFRVAVAELGVKYFTKSFSFSLLLLSFVLSSFLTGRMFVREPSWKYSANLVGS